MKNLKLKKIVAAVVAAMTIATISPVGASAAWKQNSTGWWNTEGNSYSTGWRNIGNTWYYFDSTGYMKTGWANDNGTWYYLQPSGAMKTGWANDNGTWYYLQPSGAMKTGWVNDNGTWYFTAASGAMQTGWVNDNGTWYFTATSGAMQTGWVNDNGTWYFTAASGAMQTGVVEINGKVYCLSASGAMLTGNVMINGVTYTFAASGEAVGNIPKVDKVFNVVNGVVSVGTPSSTDNSTSSGGSSSGGGGSSSSTTVAERINKVFSKAAEVKVDKVKSNEYKVSFADKNELAANGYDYVTRDFYVTNGDNTNEGITVSEKDENGVYTVTNTKGNGINVKGIVRVVLNGKVYYVTK